MSGTRDHVAVGGHRVFRPRPVDRVAAVLLRLAKRLPAGDAVRAVPAGGSEPGDGDTVIHLVQRCARTGLLDDEHPGSSISEITERTGFPQSHVSASVARLCKASALIATTDPADRRRTLVSPNPEILGNVSQMEWTPVDAVLARAIRGGDLAEVPQAVAALELLARLLTPADPEPAPPRDKSA